MLTLQATEIDHDTNFGSLLTTHGLIHIKDMPELTLDGYKTLFETMKSSLGKPLVTDRHVLDESRIIQDISDEGLFSRNDVAWHNDWSYGRGNYFGTMLYAVKNAAASPTWFVDMAQAPKELKDAYRGCEGLYYPPSKLQGTCFTEKQLRILEKQKVTRPFVFTHPCGLETLYCSPGTIQDSEVDLTPIIDWAEENAYRHEWVDGDILLWDNLRMMHRREAFEGIRQLWRIQFMIH